MVRFTNKLTLVSQMTEPLVSYTSARCHIGLQVCLLHKTFSQGLEVVVEQRVPSHACATSESTSFLEPGLSKTPWPLMPVIHFSRVSH